MLRRLLLILTILPLIATGVAQAGLPVAGAGVMTMEICAEGGPRQISLDAQGQPVPAMPGGCHCKHCLDCAAIPAVALPDAAALPQPPRARLAATLTPLPVRQAARLPGDPEARGPPIRC
ncbi:hypothetical protein ACEYYB_05935 [Paracoccus sp. p4-l81]|uniref:hypothetical protein n=1 Tax=unclassified Paracoccus (in: a-proteobacteria) TaxID=2688777 RepID=UPI0035B913D6